MDDGVESAEPVDLVGDGFRLRDVGKVTDDDVLGAADLLAGLFRARGAAGAQDDLVPFVRSVARRPFCPDRRPNR